MKARSIKGKNAGEIRAALEQSMADGFLPTLAIVFLSVKQDLETISGLLNEKGIQVFGATTAGEFIDGDIESGSVVMLLLDMNPAYFKIEFLETNIERTLETAIKLGIAGREAFTKPSLIIATGGVFIDGEKIIEGILQGFGEHTISTQREVTVFGGMAGDDLLGEKPLVFTNGKSRDNAIIALIIDEDKIEVSGIATCGWKAIGTTKTVTKSENNIVYTIDDKPALDMLMKYLGVEVKLEGNKEIVTFQSSWYYPLQVERENLDPVIRTARFANTKDRSLICTGNVPQGAMIRFSLPPDFDAIEKVVEECREFKEDTQPAADALIMFSCVSRHLSFGSLIKEEIDQVQQVWKAPMAGFFTYGEYGRSKTGKHEFHNNTCCLVTLKEK
jgi:hypothetical protein